MNNRLFVVLIAITFVNARLSPRVFSVFQAPVASAETLLHVTDSTLLEFLKSKKANQLESNSTFSGDVSEPVLLSSPGKIPVLLIPLHASSSTVDISAPSLKSVIGELNQAEVSRLLSVVMVEVTGIQMLIRKRKLDEAKSKLSALQARYPEVAFLNFIRASLLFLEGNRVEAKSAVISGLKAHPDYEEGKRFLKEINGGKGE